MRSLLDIAHFLASQPRLMSALRPVAALGIDDCWVGAGLIRNAVWDHLHGKAAEAWVETDVDVVYCDHHDARPDRDLLLENDLAGQYPHIPWSVHNQARMHERNGEAPYRSTEDAIRCWPETATAIAARVVNDQVEVIAPHGVDDLVDLVVRPSPAFQHKMPIYRSRLAAKNWAARWPRLRFLDR
ncbi:MAG TPA: nucleotidyltransferase family protein [Hyphomicrobiaceae bacterium]|nr:nucleotidyltransferase family protein [Hyphomicrobiaceae bacterium]